MTSLWLLAASLELAPVPPLPTQDACHLAFVERRPAPDAYSETCRWLAAAEEVGVLPQVEWGYGKDGFRIYAPQSAILEVIRWSGVGAGPLTRGARRCKEVEFIFDLDDHLIGGLCQRGKHWRAVEIVAWDDDIAWVVPMRIGGAR